MTAEKAAGEEGHHGRGFVAVLGHAVVALLPFVRFDGRERTLDSLHAASGVTGERALRSSEQEHRCAALWLVNG